MKTSSEGTAVAKKGGCEKMRLCEKPGMGRAGARECATSWQSPARTPPARWQVATRLQSTGGGHQATTERVRVRALSQVSLPKNSQVRSEAVQVVSCACQAVA